MDQLRVCDSDKDCPEGRRCLTHCLGSGWACVTECITDPFILEQSISKNRNMPGEPNSYKSMILLILNRFRTYYQNYSKFLNYI